MASILPSSVIGDIRGKIGNQVYSRNAGGLYVRNRVTPINPNTNPQQESRARVTTAVSLWQTLSNADRNTWHQIATGYTRKNRLGVTTKIGGYNLFVRNSVCRQWLGLSGGFNPTASRLPSISRINAAVCNSTLIQCGLTTRSVIATQYQFICCTKPRAASQRSFNPSARRLLDTFQQAADTTAVVDLTFFFTAAFGLPLTHVGKIINFGLREVNVTSGEVTAIQWGPPITIDP